MSPQLAPVRPCLPPTAPLRDLPYRMGSSGSVGIAFVVRRRAPLGYALPERLDRLVFEQSTGRRKRRNSPCRARSKRRERLGRSPARLTGEDA